MAIAQDTGWAVGLALIAFLTRLPFRSQVLYHWDSVNFANAMREFDVIKEHPQPPGYIVYVWLCRAMDLLFHEAQVTMVWISAVSSALAVVALFYLGRAMWGRRVGWIAALLLASSPLFWFYGEIALPHTLDTFLVVLSVWWLYEVMRGNTGCLLPVVVVLGIAGGVRQQTLVFLIPLALLAVRRVSFKRLLVAASLGAVVCLIWFVPLMISCGGIIAYMGKMSEFTMRFQKSTSILMGAGWSGVAYNIRKLGMYTLYGWGVGLIPILVYVPMRFWHRQRPRSWERLWFLALWIGPALGFYALIHMGQQGLIFVFLPALLLASAAALVRLLRESPGSNWLAVTATVLVLINAGLFCLMPEHPLGPGTQHLLTRDTLVSSDRYYQDRFAVIREHFSPENAVILAASSEHVAYYLPKYVKLPFHVVSNWETRDGGSSGSRGKVIVTPDTLGLQPDAEKQMTVVIFDSELASFNESPTFAHGISLEHGGLLEYFLLKEDEALYYDLHSFGIARK